MDGGWARLAELIRAESRALYKSNRALARASGLSLRTIEKLTEGKSRGYRDQTLHDLEAALRWMPGSVSRILDGGQPERVDDPILARVLSEWPQLSLRDRRIVGQVVTALLDS